MNTKTKILSIILCIALCLSVFSACNQDQEKTITGKGKSTSAYFGTETILYLYDDFTLSGSEEKFEKAWTSAKNILAEIEEAVSISVESSDISKFNELKYGESMQISELTFDLLTEAKNAYADTNGLYDPTVYNLVDLWGFTPRFNDYNYSPSTKYDRAYENGALPLPQEKYISAFTKLADFSKIEILGNEKDGYTIVKNIQSVEIDGEVFQAKMDLGGVAKGYAVKKIEQSIRAQGYEYGYINCGSSSMALLKSYSKTAVDNKTYKFDLGIRKPREGGSDEGIYLKARTSDVMLSSSGDYEHSYYLDGKIYCHIVNPFTGLPMNIGKEGNQKGISTITVIGGSGDYDDALSTALCLMEFDEALKYINENLMDMKIFVVLFDQTSEKYEFLTNVDETEYFVVDNAYSLASKLENGKIIYTGSILK